MFATIGDPTNLWSIAIFVADENPEGKRFLLCVLHVVPHASITGEWSYRITRNRLSKSTTANADFQTHSPRNSQTSHLP
jgi:hypothetical protein